MTKLRFDHLKVLLRVDGAIFATKGYLLTGDSWGENLESMTERWSE